MICLVKSIGDEVILEKGKFSIVFLFGKFVLFFINKKILKFFCIFYCIFSFIFYDMMIFFVDFNGVIIIILLKCNFCFIIEI